MQSIAGSIVAVVVAVGALLGLVWFVYHQWKGESAVAQQAKAEADEVDSTEQKIEQEEAALAAQLAKNAAARLSDDKATAATDAQLEQQIKAAEGGSDALLDGYLISHGLAKPKK